MKPLSFWWFRAVLVITPPMSLLAVFAPNWAIATLIVVGGLLVGFVAVAFALVALEFIRYGSPLRERVEDE